MPAPTRRCLPLLACNLPCGDIEAIPEVDTGYSDDQGRECLLVVMQGRRVPDLVRHRIPPIAEAGRSLGER